MVMLSLKLLFLRNGVWEDAGLQRYEAATLDGLCLRIRETLLEFGWITPSDGVNVDSYYGVATDIWHRVLSIGDIPRPEAKLRITQRVEAAEPPRTEQKRGSEEVDGAAEQNAAKRMCGSEVVVSSSAPTGNAHTDGTAGETGSKRSTKQITVCTHGRRRNQCKECGGSSICVHGRRRIQCKECTGTQLGSNAVMNEKQNVLYGHASG